MSRCGVILCECNGAVERRISLQELNSFIHNISPDLDIIIGNDLCKPQHLDLLLEKSGIHPSVIAACSEIRRQSHFWQEPDDTKSSPFFTKYVNILSEIDSHFSDIEVSDRIKLLLESQISRASSCEALSHDNLRLRFSPPQEKTTRRNLLSVLSPQHEVIPSILSSNCPGARCNLCAGACPAEAISDYDNSVKIDKTYCTGCGSCVSACPHGAISYPGYSLSELEREIEGLLSKNIQLPYRVLAIACQSCSKADDAILATISPNMFTVKVPSLAMASPLLLLHAFNIGADGIILIHNEGKCNSKISAQSLHKNVRFIQELLWRWGIDKNRIGYINKADVSDTKLHDKLQQFAGNAMSLGQTPFKSVAGSMTFEGMYNLAAIIKEMDRKLEMPGEDLLADECVPFGSVSIEQKQCTGCSSCAQICPTGAISTCVSDDSSHFELMFQHNKCIACELCAGICPEKCIRIQQVLKFDRLSNVKETILESALVHCRKCDRPYAPKSMIDALKQKLGSAGVTSTEWTAYCPSCRVAIQQKR